MTLRRLLITLSLFAAFVAAAEAQDFSNPGFSQEDAVPQTSQQPAPAAEINAPTKYLGSYVEVGAVLEGLNNGFGNWYGGYVRGAVTHGSDVVNFEVTGMHEFGDQGVYFGVGDTHTFNQDWYGSLFLGTSAGGSFYPTFRTDAFINRKWLERRQFITIFGAGYYNAKDVHHDTSFFLGGVYYFDAPWIVEGGVRWNISSPGSVFTQSQYIAVTQGRDKHHFVVLRAGFGREGYQIVGPATALVDFHSQDASVTWRQWLKRPWGFNAVVEYYHNPFYQRAGVSLGVFREF